MEVLLSEVVQITTDVPDLVGYGETMPYYTWRQVTDEAVARVKGHNATDFLGQDGDSSRGKYPFQIRLLVSQF
jgi:hypothetical protein